jgi:hypothetical protein
VRIARWAGLARKALRRPPGYVLRRLAQELRRQGGRRWSRVRPGRLDDAALLRLTGAPSVAALWERQAAAPFFVAPDRRDEWGRRFLEHFPRAKAEILEAAEAVLAHEFDLLGSGPVRLGERLPWHEDFKTGRRWPLAYCHDIDYDDFGRPSDVKVPWELSRCQHFAILGQAFVLTGDERFAQEFVAEVTDWVEANPWARGVNWACTMDVALRAVSWIWGFYFFAGSGACESPAFRSLLLRALVLHGEFVAANLELADLNGNHYLIDGVGLVFLGLFFRGTRMGARWLRTGTAIVIGELPVQVHEDGVDFEQSTAYHRVVLEGFLTSVLLLRRHGTAVPTAAWRRIERMHEFVAAYTKPTGRAALIGDADDARIQRMGLQPVTDHRYLLSTAAVVFDRADFKQAAGRFWEESFWLLGPDAARAFERIPLPPPGLPSVAFPAGGFYVLRGEGAHLILDCGEVGMRGRGGHGHNDVLSFELVLRGVNLVTDCGAYVYTTSPEWRNRFRSTAFHNTLEIDDEELNPFTGPHDLWQLRYEAVPTPVTWRPGPGADYVRGGHRGYARLAPPVIHHREVLLQKAGAWAVVRDVLDGAGVHRLVWRFHLDPGVRGEAVGPDVRLSTDGGTFWLLGPADGGGLELGLEPGWVSPRYGVKHPTSVIVARVTTAMPRTALWVFADRRLTALERAACLALLPEAA